MTRIVRALALVILASTSITTANAQSDYTPPLSDATFDELKVLYRTLIDAENAHDLPVVKSMLFSAPVSLFISRTEPVARGDWGGYWGTSSIVEHFGALYDGTFRIDPNYAEERVVGLTRDVAETYAPVTITSGYGGQAPVARRFLMVLEWVKTTDGWRVATDIPLPIPLAPQVVH
jgi:hypothetical protein